MLQRIIIVSPDAPGPHEATEAGHAALRLAQRLTAEGADVGLLVPRGVPWQQLHAN